MKYWFKRLKCRFFGHDWQKLGGGGEKDSGFVFKCTRCGTVGFDVEAG